MTKLEPLIFGSSDPNIQYSERRAAYVVIKREGNVAMVRSGEKYFLPGGGSLAGESPEETIVREVLEELALQVRLLRGLGEATQYFHSADDDRHYKMTAVFFAGELTGAVEGVIAEHQLDWVPIGETTETCFHECHAWAVRQA